MRTLRGIVVGVMGLMAFVHSANAADLDQAPPSFTPEGALNAPMDFPAVPVDFQSVVVDYVFDYATKTATGKATIIFNAGELGYPMFDLVPAPLNLSLNGNSLGVERLQLVEDPDKVTKLRVLTAEVAANSSNSLVIEFKLNPNDITYSNGNIRVGFFMSDLDTGGRAYFEQYGPANLEFDHYEQVVNVELKNVTKEHNIYANGEVTSDATNKWQVTYPAYFTTSSFYLHISEKGRFIEKQFAFEGKANTFPVLIYGAIDARVTEAVDLAKAVLKENEETFGPFTHAKIVAYITDSPFDGGMEHCGATMTSTWALQHEFTHFWFARGVMPADGNAGWIDEAVASWRDNEYPRAESEPTGEGINLSGFSVYKRETTIDAYDYGADLIATFDGMFSGVTVEDQTGMRAILRSFYGEQQKHTIVIDTFKDFLQTITGKDLTDLFNKYIMGAALIPDSFHIMQPNQFVDNKVLRNHRHPRPFTKAELKVLR